MDTTTIKVDQEIKISLEKLFRFNKYGVEHCVRTYEALRELALKEMQGMFQESELALLVGAYRQYTPDADFQYDKELFQKRIESYVERYQDFPGLDEMMEKLRQISPYQQYFLLEEIYRLRDTSRYASVTEFYKQLAH